MARTIVICCDGTGNTFDDSVTNVTRLIRFLDLDDPDRQVAVYAQGVGTNGARDEKITTFRRALRDPAALRVVTPRVSRLSARTWLISVLGLAFGYGIKSVVREMYRHLADLHQDPNDRIYLFGFSRGAFAVRALAGLIYRCGLPECDGDDFPSRFNRAWRLFRPIIEPSAKVATFRATGQRRCTIEFLGVWDTVKSYGGLVPIKLPHLRHNPIVRHVAHALALHERRAWFKATTWGQLDIDIDRAMTRVHAEDCPRYKAQTIAEVWFTGFHFDIGSGDIALRWMLGEALHTAPGLALTQSAWKLLAQSDPVPSMNDSSKVVWGLVEQLPRLEIFNDRIWPYRRWVWGSDGARKPAKVQRNERVAVHVTNNDAAVVGPANPCETWRPDSTSAQQRLPPAPAGG
jgi:hypothetical protein